MSIDNLNRLEILQRNGLRLLKLVNTLLDFSRIEAGRVQAVYEPTDLARTTTELASTFRSLIERTGMSLVVECPPLPEEINLAILHAESSVSKYITISVSVFSIIPNLDLSPQDLMAAADKALYAAKQQGRDRLIPFQFNERK